MLPEPLTAIVDDVDQDLERIYAEWCLEVEHPDLVAFVDHLLEWKLVSIEQGRAVLEAAHPADAETYTGVGPPSNLASLADIVPTRPPTDESIEDPASASVDEVPGVRRDLDEVEEFDLFDEADMATVHDAAWPGRPVESDEVEVIDTTSAVDAPDPIEAFGPETVPVAEDWADEDAEKAAALAIATPQPAPAQPSIPPGPSVQHSPATPAGGRFDAGPEPLTPFTAPDDSEEEESIGDLETVIKRTVDLGDLDTILRKKAQPAEDDLRSMVTVVPPKPEADFEADTVLPAPHADGSRARDEAWGSSEAEADDTDTVTQAPPELAADLLEGFFDEDDEPSTDDIEHADLDEPGEAHLLTDFDDDAGAPASLAATRVPASRGAAAEPTRPVDPPVEPPAELTWSPSAAVFPNPLEALTPVVRRFREEPRLRVTAFVGVGLALAAMAGVGWQVNASFEARAERQRQAFTRAVTTGSTQAARIESGLVAGLGPLEATATLLTEALENGPRWRGVVGEPPAEFRSENTLPEQGVAFDRSPDRKDGPRWIDLQVPAVVTPDIDQQNPRWGIVSELFQRHLPPLLNDRPAISAVWVGLEDGFYITLPGRGQIPDAFDPREDPVYRAARAAASVDWQVSPYGRLSATRAMIAPKGAGEVLGVVGIELDIEWVTDQLLPRSLVGVPGVGGVLVDQGAMIVAATSLEEAKAINPTLFEGMAEADTSRSPGYRIEADAPGGDRVFVYHRLGTMGWTHIIYGPQSRLTATTQTIVPGVGGPPED